MIDTGSLSISYIGEGVGVGGAGSSIAPSSSDTGGCIGGCGVGSIGGVGVVTVIAAVPDILGFNVEVARTPCYSFKLFHCSCIFKYLQ